MPRKNSKKTRDGKNTARRRLHVISPGPLGAIATGGIAARASHVAPPDKGAKGPRAGDNVIHVAPVPPLYKVKEPPKQLSKEAAKFFRKYQGQLAADGLLTERTYSAFLHISEAYAVLTRTRIQLAAHGEVIKNGDSLEVSAYMRAWIHADKIFTTHAKLWGLLPTYQPALSDEWRQPTDADRDDLD